MVAHRGACTERPENTVAAFRLAAEQGADAIELDVMRCQSGELVVFHDDDLRRLAARPERIRETPLARLREVRIGGEPIPTLAEVYAALPPHLLVNVELKSPARHGLAQLGALGDDGLAAEVARFLDGHGLGGRTLVSSFDPILLGRFRRRAPRVATGLLFQRDMARPLRRAWSAAWLRPAAMHPEARLVDARQVEGWHRAGRAVNVWTVDDAHEIAWLASLGVDGIITNRPVQARAALTGYYARLDPAMSESTRAASEPRTADA